MGAVFPKDRLPPVLDAIDHPEPTTATSPYMQDWSLGVERELAKNTLLDVTYVGDNGTHLFEPIQGNEPYGYSPTDTPQQRAARYPYYNFGTYGLNGQPFSPGSILSGVNTSAGGRVSSRKLPPEAATIGEARRAGIESSPTARTVREQGHEEQILTISRQKQICYMP